MNNSNSAPSGAQHIWCKICGITAADDARFAQAAGADAIGLNFYRKSQRYVERHQAADICAGSNLTRVGVFVDADPSWVREILDVCELDMLQFHGAESADYCNQFELPYMKAVRVRADMDWQALAAYDTAWALLLDTYVHGVQGGTGATFDWSLWPDNVHPRKILAGGLDAHNVRQAIRSTQPFGVDVAGGVEGAAKGRKDPAKVKEFLLEVRSGTD